MPRKTSSVPVGIVVVGAGAMGSFHAESVANLKRANLIAVVDPAAKQARAVARRLGCRAFADADEALSQPGVEAVVIVTPERIRQAPIAAALARRLPIFLEKPLAVTLAEGRALARQIKAARVPFQIGFQRRFDPDIVAIRDALAKWGPPEILRSLTRDPKPPSLEAGLRCFAEAYRREIASFVQSVRNGTPPQPGLDEALSSLRVADAILRSLRGGKPVALQG